MSGFVVMVPVIAGWPVFAAAAVAAGALMGMRLLDGVAARQAQEEEDCLEVGMPGNYALADAVDEGESLTLQGNGFTVVFKKTGRGDCVMDVRGRNKTKAELESVGKELLDRIAQQYAYQKITQELKKKGFQIAQEKVDEDRTIRLTARRIS